MFAAYLSVFRPAFRPFAVHQRLVLDAVGNLYGTTTVGGNLSECYGGGCGVVFQLAPGVNGSWTEKVLYTFCSLSSCADGNAPMDSLILDGAGRLYGTTSGLYAGGGNVFQLTPAGNGSWTETVLFSFDGSHGYYPHAGLIAHGPRP
jgi:hypothetical protein